jgi:hypothetical protein
MSNPGLEIGKEAAKAAVVEIVSPATAILADVLGGALGDRLSNWRKSKPAWEERNRRETLEAAAKLIIQRRIEAPAENTRPECIEEIVVAAGETSAPELKLLYASLIAAAIDPARAGSYRREFVHIVSKLEPLDAVVLPLLTPNGPLRPSRQEFAATQLGATLDEVDLAFRNLEKLGLVSSLTTGHPTIYPVWTAAGRQFLRCVEN